jgi:hypothetical protein
MINATTHDSVSKSAPAIHADRLALMTAAPSATVSMALVARGMNRGGRTRERKHQRESHGPRFAKRTPRKGTRWRRTEAYPSLPWLAFANRPCSQLPRERVSALSPPEAIPLKLGTWALTTGSRPPWAGHPFTTPRKSTLRPWLYRRTRATDPERAQGTATLCPKGDMAQPDEPSPTGGPWGKTGAVSGRPLTDPSQRCGKDARRREWLALGEAAAYG